MADPRRIGAIIGAYTGYVCGSMEDLLAYAGDKLGLEGPLPYTSMRDKLKELQEASRDDFLALGAWCVHPPLAESELDKALQLADMVLGLPSLSPAPWQVSSGANGPDVLSEGTVEPVVVGAGIHDAQFIAAARTVVPALAVCVRELRARVWLEERKHGRELAGERAKRAAANVALANRELEEEGPYCPLCKRGLCS
jgi:hypothetical protein